MKNTVQCIFCFGAIAVCLLSTASSAHAGFITFGDAANITDDNDVSTNGTSVFAFSLGNAGATDVVNEVTFIGLNATDSNSNLTFDGLASPSATAFRNGAAGSAFSTLSANYQDVLGSGNFRGGNGSQTITLGNLEVGQGYEVQFWVNDARSRGDQETVPRQLQLPGCHGALKRDH